MTSPFRPLADHLNGDPQQQAVLRTAYEVIQDRTLWPWVTARWETATVTGLVRRDESGHAYMFAEGTWHLDRLGRDCVRPGRLERAQPTWAALPDPERPELVLAALAMATAAARAHGGRESVPEPRCSATFVNSETRLVVNAGRLRYQGSVLLLRAGHRWLQLHTKFGAVSPKLTHLELHPTLKAV